MSKSNVVEIGRRDELADPLTELLRAGAQQLIHQAVEHEVQDLLAGFSDCKTGDGRAAVVRNGYLPARALQTGIGPVTVKIG